MEMNLKILQLYSILCACVFGDKLIWNWPGVTTDKLFKYNYYKNSFITLIAGTLNGKNW